MRTIRNDGLSGAPRARQVYAVGRPLQILGLKRGEEEHVPRPALAARLVQIEPGLHPDRPGDDVGTALGLRRRQFADVDLELHQRVVAGQLAQRLAAGPGAQTSRR